MINMLLKSPSIKFLKKIRLFSMKKQTIVKQNEIICILLNFHFIYYIINFLVIFFSFLTYQFFFIKFNKLSIYVNFNISLSVLFKFCHTI